MATLEDFTNDVDKAVHSIQIDELLLIFMNFYFLLVIKAYDVVRDLRELIEAALINSTPVHLTPNAIGTSDVHYFLDLEMAMLGSSPSEYAEQFNDLKMKEEYGFSSDNEFFRLRLKVMIL